MRQSCIAAGAVFGCAYGWERPNWFSLGDPRAEAQLSFRRPGWFEAVREECLAVRDGVGIADLSAFSKFEVMGPGASCFMERLGANRPPQSPWRIGLTHALTPAGGIASEFTVTKLEENRYYLTSAAAAERHDEDLLRLRAAEQEGVGVMNLTEGLGILAVMGPKARDLLTELTDADLGDGAFPWLSAAEVTLAGLPVRLLRVSYVGELGWELHLPMVQMEELHRALWDKGERYGLRPFGAYAMNAMRLEKGYRAWGLDLTSERTPLEAGLDFLVCCEGRDFIGREALLARRQDPAAWRMTLLELESRDGLDPFGPHAVLQNNRPVGIATSGAYGHRTEKLLALAYLTPRAEGEDFTLEILGEALRARVLPQALYDPDNTRLRGSPAVGEL